ncbi:PQ loop repeat-domain-containing protein [Gilbertella persicaria]|uniref:PQ loop repeat-domain-containing protein n=1 Tax=Gilbertella persicaria TaxID=101096 RepID=UPI00221F0735|nr:PQ loop repeat-domain-containing protein [Gilbertella persicaria]KAI8095122.1 PQ loop repeat-domain-containing protein [Gilbertella persicaria]
MDPTFASSVAGYLSILCWLIVFTPQLWENYRRKSGEGLSMTFLVVWLAGDVFNLLGVIMQDLLVTMFVLALYYTIADMGLIWQVIYYRRRLEEEEVMAQETSPLLASTSHVLDQKKARHTSLLNIMSAISIVLVTIISCYAYYRTHDNQDKLEGFQWLPQLMGWSSAILYVGSRVPQILKNYRNKSTEGLSFGMFLCAVMGNVFFTSSIFLKSTELDYIIVNLSWIVGSCGTLVFDFIIFLQFFVYDDRKQIKVIV